MKEATASPKDVALKLALEALGWTDEWRPQGLREEAISAIKEALAQDELCSSQEPEPDALTVVYMSGVFEGKKLEREACLNCYSPDDTATDWADKIRARGNT